MSIKLQVNLNNSVLLNSKNSSLLFLEILDTPQGMVQEGFSRVKERAELWKMKAGKNLPSLMICICL